jgi:hypothetical protein
LTLVIDLKDGELVPTRYVESSRSNLADAFDDLQAREGSPKRMIGFVDLANNAQSNKSYPNHADVFKYIADWCKDAKFDAVIWTALPSNFKKEIGKEFSVNNAVSYLQALPSSAQKKSFRIYE